MQNDDRQTPNPNQDPDQNQNDLNDVYEDHFEEVPGQVFGGLREKILEEDGEETPLETTASAIYMIDGVPVERTLTTVRPTRSGQIPSSTGDIVARCSICTPTKLMSQQDTSWCEVCNLTICRQHVVFVGWLKHRVRLCERCAPVARRKIRKHVILGTLWNSVLQFFEALTSGQVSRYDMWFRPDLLKILKSGAEDSAPRNTRTTPTTNHSYNPNPNPNVPTRR